MGWAQAQIRTTRCAHPLRHTPSPEATCACNTAQAQPVRDLIRPRWGLSKHLPTLTLCAWPGLCPEPPRNCPHFTDGGIVHGTKTVKGIQAPREAEKEPHTPGTRGLESLVEEAVGRPAPRDPGLNRDSGLRPPYQPYWADSYTGYPADVAGDSARHAARARAHARSGSQARPPAPPRSSRSAMLPPAGNRGNGPQALPCEPPQEAGPVPRITTPPRGPGGLQAAGRWEA